MGAYPPAGVILFKRNVDGAQGLARLVGDLREVLEPDAVLMVDQEGGRVARLGPPHWRVQPAAGVIGARYGADPAAAARLAFVTGALIGLDCVAAGFDVVCAPVLDVIAPGATAAIGDRSFGGSADVVVALGMAVADGLLAAGVQPVGKHAPGHGRVGIDSHFGLPRLSAEVDLGVEVGVFSACRALPWMMTAHVVYEAVDAGRPGTLSPVVIGLIRERIGFGGVLVSDDLAMGALEGPAGARAVAALDAGCDLALHCSGVFEEMRAVLEGVGEVTAAGLARMRRGRALAGRSRLALDRAGLEADQVALLR